MDGAAPAGQEALFNSSNPTIPRGALRDGQDGQRYLVNIPRRGYQFVAPVTQGGLSGILASVVHGMTTCTGHW